MNEIPDATKRKKSSRREERRREDKILVDLLELGRNKVELNRKCRNFFCNCLKSLKNPLT
jgi:hypothetical protein